jgi:hypothetical protein
LIIVVIASKSAVKRIFFILKFKNSYADEQIYYENSKYYWVLKPLYFKLYLFLEKNVKKNKRTISKILSMFRK